MNTHLADSTAIERPISVTILGYILILVGIFAFVGSVLLWGEGFILDPLPDTELVFPITDILINTPASIIAGIGLLKVKKWGKMMAWFVSGFYIYASVEIFVQVLQEGDFPLEIIVPQVFAVIVAILLMRVTVQYEEVFS